MNVLLPGAGAVSLPPAATSSATSTVQIAKGSDHGPGTFLYSCPPDRVRFRVSGCRGEELP